MLNDKPMAGLEARADEIIPGGNLFSKRPNLYAPGLWPSHFTKASGIEVTDTNGRTYLDFATNNQGACILGAADPDVNGAVTRAIQDGSVSSLNNLEEVELAEMLLTLHPWAGAARFTRSGGEAMAVAIRIAQAHTGRSNVIRWGSGYHGWHVSSPITQEDFLPYTPGEKPAAIVLEARRYQEPDLKEIKQARDTATEIGAVFILDEITSGFRFNLGGVHLDYGVNPDIAVFAKALSNGYPMAAVVGTKDVMNSVHKTFISSTSWTDRIGPVAAIATIQKLWAKDVHEHLVDVGSKVQNIWRYTAKKLGLEISVSGPPQLSRIDFGSNECNTLFTQLMLENGYLATKDFFPTFAHTQEHLEDYLVVIQQVFAEIAGGARLRGPVAESGLVRKT